jgi:hypothetical protein
MTAIVALTAHAGERAALLSREWTASSQAVRGATHLRHTLGVEGRERRRKPMAPEGTALAVLDRGPL